MQNYDTHKIKILFEQDLRGEMTVRKQEFFSFYSNTYINSLLKILGLEKSSEENFALAQSLIPTIIKDAVEREDLNILKNMKNEIMNIPFRRFSRKSPLHISCKLGLIEITKFLISCKLNVNELDYNEYTPLDYACQYAKGEIANLVRNHGGVLNKNVNNPQLFNRLAYKGELEKLKILYENGANLLACDYDNRNSAHIAAAEGNTEIIKFMLFEAKIDIISYDRWNNTPYSEGNDEIKKLIEQKYKIGMK